MLATWIAALFLLPPLWAQEPTAPIARISLSPKQLEALRQSIRGNPQAALAFEPIRKLADRALRESPGPIKRIVSEGRLHTDSEKKESLAARRDLFKAEALAYAYALSGKGEYGQKAREFVLAWAATYEPEGNPINETEFTRLMKAYDLTRGLFTDGQRLEVDRWFLKMAEKQRATIQPARTTSKNNHHSHRLKIIGHVASLIPSPELIGWVAADYKRHLEVNLNADGTTYDFQQRDALHYHVYNLMPLVELALVADKNGVNLYGHTTSRGASLEKSIAFLIPYILGEKGHREFVRSKVEFDFQRSEAGDPSIRVGERWNPKEAKSLFDIAGYLNPKFHEVAFPGEKPSLSFDRLLASHH